GASGGSDPRWTMGAGFHHKSHLGRRVNCLLWSSGGGELFSVCDGGTVVLAKNLRPRRGVPAAGPPGMMGVMAFLGVHQPADTRKGRSEAAGPQALIVGRAGSPGVHLDLGRVITALPGARAARQSGQGECDVLLVMTRKRAVLLYFVVGADVG
ncbi:unnamed protein product, partial [Laminaria digitata]